MIHTRNERHTVTKTWESYLSCSSIYTYIVGYIYGYRYYKRYTLVDIDIINSYSNMTIEVEIRSWCN